MSSVTSRHSRLPGRPEVASTSETISTSSGCSSSRSATSTPTNSGAATAGPVDPRTAGYGVSARRPAPAVSSPGKQVVARGRPSHARPGADRGRAAGRRLPRPARAGADPDVPGGGACGPGDGGERHVDVGGRRPPAGGGLGRGDDGARRDPAGHRRGPGHRGGSHGPTRPGDRPEGSARRPLADLRRRGRVARCARGVRLPAAGGRRGPGCLRRLPGPLRPARPPRGSTGH